MMPVTSDCVIHDDAGPETLSSALQGYLYSFIKAKHNLSVKTEFLCRELSNLNCLVLLRVLILSIYRFKRNNFFLKTAYLDLKHFHNMKNKQVKMSQLGGGGGGVRVRGYAPPEIFDFNSSQMPRNVFKINQRTPKIQTFGT